MAVSQRQYLIEFRGNASELPLNGENICFFQYVMFAFERQILISNYLEMCMY